jgi:hypothetical protein
MKLLFVKNFMPSTGIKNIYPIRYHSKLVQTSWYFHHPWYFPSCDVFRKSVIFFRNFWVDDSRPYSLRHKHTRFRKKQVLDGGVTFPKLKIPKLHFPFHFVEVIRWGSTNLMKMLHVFGCSLGNWDNRRETVANNTCSAVCVTACPTCPESVAHIWHFKPWSYPEISDKDPPLTRGHIPEECKP